MTAKAEPRFHPFIRDDQLVVFYDAACGLCSGLRTQLARLDLFDRIAWVPLQTPGALELVGLTVEESVQTVRAVHPDGRRLQGLEVIAEVIDALAPTFGLATRAMKVGLLRRLLVPLYEAISANRKRVVACPAVPRQFAPLPLADAYALSRRTRSRAQVLITARLIPV